MSLYSIRKSSDEGLAGSAVHRATDSKEVKRSDGIILGNKPDTLLTFFSEDGHEWEGYPWMHITCAHSEPNLFVIETESVRIEITGVNLVKLREYYGRQMVIEVSPSSREAQYFDFDVIIETVIITPIEKES